MSEQEQITALAVAEMRGEMRAMRELFGTHTTQDMEQFGDLKQSINGLDGKLDSLLLREAHRDGEFAGLKRSAILASSSIAFIVSVVGLAFTFYVN
jgi:hypothetical protein